MRIPFCLKALLFAGLLLPLDSCLTQASLSSIAVTPTTMSFGGPGLSTQLTAMGTYTHGTHPASTINITDQVTWASSTPECVTVSSTGLITSGDNTCSNILVTATAPGFNGVITGTMTVNVTQPTGTGSGGTGTVASLAITPLTSSVAVPTDTSQFLAIGTTSTGATVNLTSQVAWSATTPQVATICTVGVTASCPAASPTGYGLATAVGKGTTNITAIYTNSDGTIVPPATASLTVLAGNTEQVTAVSILPISVSVTASQSAQLIALGTGPSGLDQILAPSTPTNAQLQWTASPNSIIVMCTGAATPSASCTAAGEVIGLNPGNTSVTALYTNTDGTVVHSNAVSITVSNSAPPEPLLSITIVPGNTTVSTQGMTAQYLAFGNFSTTPTYQDITNGISHPGFGGCTVLPCTVPVTPVTWISFAPEVASVDSGGTSGEDGGLVTAMGYEGSSPIYAEAFNADGTAVLSNPESFACEVSPPQPPVCEPGPAVPEDFATLTVFNVGENTSTWQITAPNGNGAADLIHCGPGWAGAGGSVCTGTYPVNSVVTLTEASPAGSFGGWSANCPVVTATTCQVTLTGNMSIGAIFY
jgi:hypothetical protein